MRLMSISLATALLLGSAAPGAAIAAEQTYDYVITHSHYGKIGTYDRVVDRSGGVMHARSQMQIAVKMLGLVVHREVADQSETWRGGRLIAFHCTTTVNGAPINVSGQAQGDKFLVISPTGTATAPIDVAASDPMGFKRLGHGQMVSIKSGKIEAIDVTGGESEQVTIDGTPQPARHFRVSTVAQPNKWEVWLDPQGVPLKFRSLEGGAQVDFTLALPPKANALAMEGTSQGPVQQ
jgi:hypothetical protein